jgi:hypothetical protein
MRGKRSWLLLTLALVGVLALGATLLQGGDGTRSVSLDRKMSPTLRQLSAIYRDFAVQQLKRIQLNDVIQAQAVANEKGEKSASRLLLKLLPGRGEANGVTIQGADSRSGLDGMVDPVLQQRWGNPAFDVGRGVLTATSDPKTLESAFLKIRKVWKQDKLWKAFCEFAIFKAEEIAGKARISYLSLLPQPEIENDLGSRSTGAPRLRAGQPGNWSDKGYTGRGVIVGDVDSGVDWAHGDFLNPDGSSRILYLWDTSVNTAGKTPEALFGMTGFNYGTVWTKAEIDNGLCT